jgi:hypothetical protein
MAEAARILKEKHPDLIVDGEIQANFALNDELLVGIFSVFNVARETGQHPHFPESCLRKYCVQAAAGNGWNRRARADFVGNAEVLSRAPDGLVGSARFTTWSGLPLWMPKTKKNA